MWHRYPMIRLVAVDRAVRLDEEQCARTTFWLLEFVPATGCRVRSEPPVEITITGHSAPKLHPPLLEKVQEIAGCQFQVRVTSDDRRGSVLARQADDPSPAPSELPPPPHDHVSAHAADRAR
jgi:hypothetical protein